MTISHSRKERQQCDNQLKQMQMNVPSTYSHECEDAGDDSIIKCTESSVDGCNVITVASPGTVPHFAGVATPSIYFSGLPRPLGTGHSFVDEHIHSAENHDKAKLESQGASILRKYDVDLIQKTERARPRQCNEPTERVCPTEKSTTEEPEPDVSNDDDALLHAKNAERYRDTQLDPTTVMHDKREGLEHAHC
nr:uncharacterized protein LOC126541309 [Dermacentor andersoni]